MRHPATEAPARQEYADGVPSTTAVSPALPPTARPGPRAVPGVLALLVSVIAAGPLEASAAAATDGRQDMVQTSGKASARRPAKVDADQLVTLFPGMLGAWQQTELGKTPPQRVAGPAPAVRAEYTLGEHVAKITVSTGLLPAAVEPGKRHVSRQERGEGKESRVTVALANGVSITASSRSAEAAALEAMLQSIDLARAEAMRAAR